MLFCTGLSGFAQQRIIHDTIRSEILNQTRRINILLPDTSSAHQWNGEMNVAYVLDGYDTFVNIVGSNLAFLSDMESDNGVPAFLIVGIASENTRQDDFIVEGTYRKTGRADRFLKFMSDELFPYIENRYRVTPHRIGVGHSLGGSLLFRALCDRDSLFNAYLIFSPNLVYGNGKLLQDFQAKKPGKLDKFLYISNGDTGDMEQSFAGGVRRLDSLIAGSPCREGLHTRIDFLEDAEHHESLPISIGRAAKEYIRFSYSPPCDSIRTRLLAQTDYAEAIKQYYHDRRPYLGYTYYPGVYGFYNTWIILAFQQEQFKKALPAIEWAAGLHRNSDELYVLYLAKADAYAELGDKKAALAACDEALQSLRAVHGNFAGEDYQWAEKEIGDKVAEINKSL